MVKSPAPGAFVQIGDLASPIALVALAGLAVTAVLFAPGLRGGILIGLAFTTALAAAAGLVRPSGVVAWPPSLAPTFLRMDLADALRHVDLVLVFLIMLVTAVCAVPVGVAADIYLEAYAPKNWFTAIIEINVTNLAGVPSIVMTAVPAPGTLTIGDATPATLAAERTKSTGRPLTSM